MISADFAGSFWGSCVLSIYFCWAVCSLRCELRRSIVSQLKHREYIGRFIYTHTDVGIQSPIERIVWLIAKNLYMKVYSLLWCNWQTIIISGFNYDLMMDDK